jgi:hypothetical protein
VLDLPHCEEGEHEHFARCPDCDPEKVEGARDGMVVANAKQGTYKLCPTCKGTRQGGPSLGMKPCDFPPTRYLPGQTVKLSAAYAKPYLKEGVLAASPANPDELMVRHAAKKLGMVEA